MFCSYDDRQTSARYYRHMLFFLIDDICLPVFENIYILIIVLLCLFIYVFFLYFLKFILSILFEDHIGNKCAIVCFNVSILGKYYIYMYYNVLPNKLTHTNREYCYC